jgi:hypothetical protein
VGNISSLIHRSVDDAVSSDQPAILGTTGYIRGQDANEAKLCRRGHCCADHVTACRRVQRFTPEFTEVPGNPAEGRPVRAGFDLFTG